MQSTAIKELFISYIYNNKTVNHSSIESQKVNLSKLINNTGLNNYSVTNMWFEATNQFPLLKDIPHI